MIVKGDTGWAGTDNQNGAIFMNTAGRGLLGAFSTSYARPLITANSNYIDLGSAGTSLINGFRFYAGSAGSSATNPAGTIDFYTSGSNNRLHIAKGGGIGIGTDDPAVKLDVNGSIKCNSVTETSDYRLKENIKPLESTLDKIKNLKPVSYNLKKDGSYDEGLIAHEVQEIFPSLVTGDKDAKQEDGSDLYQSVAYGKLVTHLVKAVQELSAVVEMLKNG